MRQIPFCKFHGFGNDYIVFEAEDLEAVEDLNAFAEKVCRRNTGIGGDGITVLEKLDSQTADYDCRIINPDGSEAGFSGNGTRCAAAYLHYKNLWREKSLRLKTKSGVKNYEFLRKENLTFWFRAELGQPAFDLPGKFADEPKTDAKEFGLLIPSEEMAVRFTFVDVGNPVAVIFVDNFEQINWRRFGSKIEIAPLFPDRTNVVFARVIDRENIEIRIWERGAGETSSSGTCSIAAAVASAFTDKTDRQISVHAPGGTTETLWREDGEMLITGRADLSFCGDFYTN